MPVLHPIKNLKSIVSRKQFAQKNGYGGETYGSFDYGFYNLASGIYRVRRYNGKVYKEKMEFYQYVVTNTASQIAGRSKFASAVHAWQGLADSIQQGYNKRAIGRHMLGFNLFISEYMKL